MPEVPAAGYSGFVRDGYPRVDAYYAGNHPCNGVCRHDGCVSVIVRMVHRTLYWLPMIVAAHVPACRFCFGNNSAAGSLTFDGVIDADDFYGFWSHVESWPPAA